MKTFKDFINDDKTQRIEEKYEVEVSVRDARKANDIAYDMFRGEYNMDGSNVFVFKKKSSKEDFLDELESQRIEVLNEAGINVNARTYNLHKMDLTSLKNSFIVNSGLSGMTSKISKIISQKPIDGGGNSYFRWKMGTKRLYE